MPGTFGDRYKQVEKFTSSGTFTVPAGVEVVEVLLVGGGASGGVKTGDPGYAGGGGGGEVVFAKVTVEGETTIAVDIGAGGDAKTTDGTGNAGSDSTFGSLLTAYGGSGGSASAGSGIGGGGGGRSAGEYNGNTDAITFQTGGVCNSGDDYIGHSGKIVHFGRLSSHGGAAGGGANSTLSSSGGDSFFADGGSAVGGGTVRAGGGGASYGDGTAGMANTANSPDAAANSGAGTGGCANATAPGDSGAGGSGYCEVYY